MRVSISNIAWDVAEDAAVAALLARHGVDAVDLAPSKYFSDPATASKDDVARVRDWWNGHGIEVVGMQSLLFGTSGLNLFGAPEVREAMLERLAAVCRIGGWLGAGADAPRLVFGSPKNRDRGGLDAEQAQEVALPFFRRLGDIAQSCGVLVCLEPVPARYGANFLTGSIETAALVARLGHPAVKMQLDTGALAVNGEDVGEVLQRCAPHIGHVHASEPDLLPLGDWGLDGRDSLDGRDNRDSLDGRDNRDSPDNRGSLDSRDNRGSLDSRDNRDSLDGRESLDNRDTRGRPDNPPNGQGADHAAAAAALRTHLPRHVVTIEMLATAHEPHLPAIERALVVALRHYGGAVA